MISGRPPIDRIPSNAILVLEACGANRNWLDPHDRVEMTPQLKVKATDHPRGVGVILHDFSRVRVRATSSIQKIGEYYDIK
ncbi:hypothetical protein SAMN05444166_7520 [Singulisphaera sp. GP187]|nr:hypothetical protein SAMN05444166_7520 [Singulisphaera sp. GP187]